MTATRVKQGIFIRFAGIPRMSNGAVAPMVRDNLRRSTMGSFYELGWNNGMSSCIDPVFRLRVMPEGLYIDLIATELPIAEAMPHRISFDNVGLSRKMEEGILRAITLWEKGRFGKTVVADPASVTVVDGDAAHLG